jgi:hypothetical protein
MNDPIHEQWSQLQDKADSPDWHPDLPGGDFPLGTPYPTTDPAGSSQTWSRVFIRSGAIGGRWAYWFNRADHIAIADRIWNAGAPHFIGMLAVPYTGTVGPAWVLIDPAASPPTGAIELEPERRQGTRYERSKEVFDVSSSTTHIVP